jgi:hypothetical protein
MAAVIAAGCGGGGSSSAAVGLSPGQAKNLIPLAVGAVWTYNATAQSGATGQGTMTVEAAENAPSTGQAALRVNSVLLDGSTLSWEQAEATAVVRFEEKQLDQTGTLTADKQYSPPILILDESAAHLVPGTVWTEQYLETKGTAAGNQKTTAETVIWTMEAVQESVTVPAGTYSCLRVSRNHVSGKTPSTGVTWYASGVGKVKETGAGQNNDQTLELSAVSLP